MKKVSVLALLLLTAALVWSGPVDLKNVNPSDIKLSEVNLKDAEFYFNGPCEFFVTNVYYMGKKYAAVLEYDGGNTLTVKAPKSLSTAYKPQSVDLSEASLRLGSTGKVYLDNVIFNGYSYSGKLRISSTTTATVESYTPGKRVVAVSPAMPVKAVSTDEAALNKKIKELEGTIAAKDSELAMAKKSSADNSYEVTKLKAELRTLQASKVTTAGIPSSWLAIPKKTPSSKNARSVLTMATKHEAGMGSWKLTSSSLTQSDTNQKFAKYVAKVPQYDNELWYSFKANTKGKGWVGYGLHFLASGYETTRGYGFGKSYLVWFTRDPKNQTEKSYIQLYRSYDDVHMIQLSNMLVNEPIENINKIQIYVNKKLNAIIVYINDGIRLAFEADPMISWGNTVAVRTLGGPVTFSAPSVKSR